MRALIYTGWSKSGKKCGLHMYSKGGNGFRYETKILPRTLGYHVFYDGPCRENRGTMEQLNGRTTHRLSIPNNRTASFLIEIV